ncbi:MAG: hypothetical protein HUK25_02200, partial [Treponema sp.]|nr:hypothetical protein [Treponema sp.]
FKVEPVVWRVLTTKTDEDVTKYMLLSEKILISDVAFYPHLSVNRTINNQTVYSNNYKHSSIRAFLNGLSFEEKPSDSDPQSSNSDYLSKGFLQQAFTSTHQTKISETTVDNSAASTIDSYEYLEQATLYACDNTIDKIFLLSELEITTSEYKFNTDSSRIRFPTDFAWANYCDGFWLLRSPESKVSYTNGIVNYAGDYKTFQPVDRTYGGIVPALWLELPQ